LSDNISRLANDNSLSLETIFDQSEQLLFNVTEKKPNLGLLPASEVLLETFLDLETRSNEGLLAGIPSGFFDLDTLTQGFQKSDLIIIAGRPSMGKTAFALNIARNVTDLQNYPVVIFSLEMSRNQIIYRFLSNECGITNSKLRSGNINSNEWKSLSRAISSLSDLNLFIDDKSDITIAEMRTKLTTLRSRFSKIGLVIIDYLQLISDPQFKDSRVNELSRITRNLKLLAKEFNIPIIVLSQLSRSVESRINKKPLLSDLRESGCFSLSTNFYISLQKIKQFFSNDTIRKKTNLTIGVKQCKNILSLSFSRIESLFPTGYRFTYKIFAIGHYYIKLTKNHKILTQYGWKKIENLFKSDLLLLLDKHNFFSNCNDLSSFKVYPCFTLLKINNISPCQNEFVYDCWLPMTNNFLGNGYILHNSIEQDADLVLMLYREQYYSDNNQMQNIADINIAKHRNGPVGSIKLIFESNTASFSNIIRI
jgi:replicative DNA helicase